MQTGAPQVPLYTDILVSKEAPAQVLSVSVPPIPVRVYQTPGFVVPVQLGATSAVAPLEEPLRVCPQLMGIAFVQRSLGGMQVRARVKAPDAELKPVTST